MEILHGFVPSKVKVTVT